MKRREFTFIELLVILAITAVQIPLLPPAVQAVRARSRRVHRFNQPQQLAAAMQIHTRTTDGELSSRRVMSVDPDQDVVILALGNHCRPLPHLDHMPIVVAANFDPPPGVPLAPEVGPAKLFDGPLLHTGLTTAWTPKTTAVRMVQGKPVDIEMGGYPDWESFHGPIFGAVTARSYHVDGVHVLMGESSVRYVGNSIDGVTWHASGTIAGCETATAP